MHIHQSLVEQVVTSIIQEKFAQAKFVLMTKDVTKNVVMAESGISTLFI